MLSHSIKSFIVAIWLTLFTADLDAEPGSISFNRDIQATLSKNCYECHGPDAESREGGFRLDDPKSATGKADSGRSPIVPGDPDGSELITRITSSDTTDLMPPPDSNKSLSRAEIQTLRQWISEGANWEQHWALVPPERPPFLNFKTISGHGTRLTTLYCRHWKS